MRVKLNKKLVALIAGSADGTPCLQAHSTGRHTKDRGGHRMVTAPAYRLISTSKLALAVYWRKPP